MNNNPLVSVCVQTYLHAGYISQCIEGILNQKGGISYEIILGEDESNDGTREICLKYARTYPDKIRLFLRSRKDVIYIDGNATGRYNFLHNLRNARGRYIAICEGDDYWTDPYKLQKQIDFLEKNDDYSLCYHRCTLSNPALKADTQAQDSYTFTFWESLQRKNGYTLSMIFKADAIEDVDLDYYLEGLRNADWPLECLLTLNNKGYYMNESMGCYRIHDLGATKNFTIEGYFNTRVRFMTRLRGSIGFGYQRYIAACIGRVHVIYLKELIAKKDIRRIAIYFPKFLLGIIRNNPRYNHRKVIWTHRFKMF